MESFTDVSTPLWDISQISSFSNLPDHDFLTLLHKQYPEEGRGPLPHVTSGISKNITPYSMSTLTPPSEDSLSPPSDSNNNDNDEFHEPGPKRKANQEDLDAGPSQKSQHTMDDDAKGTTGNVQRRPTGPHKDETRVMKRKEQNRAAQRAFRERKEKRVKDLEDKVAALEEKNDQATHENDNLRDLLSRLQSENIMLKQSSFTFSVPKNDVSSANPNQRKGGLAFNPTSPLFSTVRSASQPPLSTSPIAHATGDSSPRKDTLDWSSLSSFDPNVLKLLDDSPELTATDGAMQLDLGYGPSSNSGLASNAPYTTIASNPLFMSFATYDAPTPSTHSSSPMQSDPNFGFDISSMPQWSTSPRLDVANMDDLFSRYLDSPGQEYSFSHENISGIPDQRRLSPQISNDTSTKALSSPHPNELFKDGNTNLQTTSSSNPSDDKGLPKTRDEIEKCIQASGLSPFVSSMHPLIQLSGSVIDCAGSKFQKTQKSDQNVELLSAWRSITSNPQYKDVDVTELCHEFASKARCDGTKVVLEPHGVNSILETLSKNR